MISVRLYELLTGRPPDAGATAVEVVPMDFLADFDRTIADLRGQVDAGNADLRPDLARAYLEKAQHLHGFGRPDAAIPEYDAAIQLLSGVDRGRVRLDKGSALRALGRLAEALEELDCALESLEGGDLGTARMERGGVLEGLGLPEPALAEYEEALPLLEGEDLAAARLSKAWLLDRLGRPEPALAECDRAVLLLVGSDFELADARRARAHFLRELGRPEEAIVECDGVIAAMAPQLEFERKTNEHLRKLGGQPYRPVAALLAAVRAERAKALEDLGRHDEAAAEI